MHASLHGCGAGRTVSGGEGLDVQRGRAALLPGSMESDPRTGLCLSFAGGMNHDLGKELWRSLKGEVVALHRGYRPGISRAFLLKSSELHILRQLALHLHRAVMHAVPPAAGRKLITGVRRKGKDRRDQREAEEKKQRDGQQAAHIAIVTHTPLQDF